MNCIRQNYLLIVNLDKGNDDYFLSKFWPLLYRVCQGSWPSLIVADEYIEPQNFWASSKSHVATTYLCMQFCSNYIGLSNQGKYYKIEVQFAKQDGATWIFYEANIFQFDIFVRKQRPTG